MKIHRVLFPASAVVMLLCTITLPVSAQEDQGDRQFDERVDSIVQNIYRGIDREFGTSIFSGDKPASPASFNDQADTASTDCEDGETTTISGSGYRWHSSRAYRNGYRYEFSYPGPPRNNSTTFYPSEPGNDNLVFRYNRVQGLFLGLGEGRSYAWNRHRMDLFGSGGYGFAEHRWRYEGGVAQQFGSGRHLFELGLEGHSLTDSDDKWLIGQTENTMSALIARDDYRDYFGRQGFSVWAGFYRKPGGLSYRVQSAYINDQYATLDRATNWSVFGGDKLFRENPAINEGSMRSILASVEIANVAERRFFSTGWSMAASAEFAGAGFGDFQFNRYLLDLRRYQPFGEFDNLNIRVRGGAATGNVPLQKMLFLGGLGTMPAFAFKDFSGNRLLLANVEYVFNGRIFDDDFFFLWPLRDLNIVTFFDAGYVGYSSDASPVRGFEPINTSTLKSDYGFAVATRDAKVRLGFAWRTDRAEFAHIFLRLERPF